ncbi:glycosyltransferase [Crossiella sp. SN42]|uniref:glycosyltransferase n=1 Tax=Crossiella sp. SN42 TaxID=2944808 RepID=UPI00207CCBDA|nr:glycosyltransferase [Crossiella sp. SN42]MCO1580235.1 glycosyltransferase [Crossiella sp. SN42]
MRALLSTIGSRGDVQPVVALAVRLRELGHQARIAAPPDYREWIESLGFPFFPVGPELRPQVKAEPEVRPAPPTAEQRRKMIAATVASQFEALPEAAADCEVIVAWSALQIAARSVAEHRGIRYVYIAYGPTTLPSPHHGPAPFDSLGQHPSAEGADFRALWAENAEFVNQLWREPLNIHRARLGLPSVTEVRDHMFTDSPWLAADPVLAPWPEPSELKVVQTGAWTMADDRPLSAEVEEFLAAGEPPVFFGFGSMAAPPELGHALLKAARALGRRAVISRGWADLALTGEPDCLTVDEVNYQALFPRLAAVVHHGGSGTTTAVTQAGTPQVIVPQMYDQHYFAERVQALGVGFAHARGVPTTDSLIEALTQVLRPEVAARAKEVAGQVRTDGTLVAARLLIG